jgi:hypothetical protein
MSQPTFHLRPFVSFLLLFSFLLSALSGVALFLRPEGSLAAWVGWSALGLDKKEWEGLHATAVVMLFLGAALHLALNWRPLLAYCRRGAAGRTPAWREGGAALLLAVLLLAGTLGKWLPMRRLIELRARFKGGAGLVRVAPPMADAESRTMAEWARFLGLDEARLLAAARAANLRVAGPGQTLAEVAERNGLSPEKVFRLLSGK